MHLIGSPDVNLKTTCFIRCPWSRTMKSHSYVDARTRVYLYVWMVIIIISATITTLGVISAPVISSNPRLPLPHYPSPAAFELLYDTQSLRTRANSRPVDQQSSFESKSETSNQATNSRHWIRWRADTVPKRSSIDSSNHTTLATASSAAAYTLIGDFTVDPTTTPHESTDGLAARQQRMTSIQICHSISFDVSIDEHDEPSQQPQVIPSPIEVDGVKWFECEISQLPRQTEIRLILILQTPPRLTESQNNASSHPSSADDSYTMARSITTASTLIILPKKEEEVESNILLETTMSSPESGPTTTLILQGVTFTQSGDNLFAGEFQDLAFAALAVTPSPPLVSNGTIDLIANDTQVREDLILLYNLTNGPNWSPTAGYWGMANVSVCDWEPSVLVCDQNRTIILEMNFRQNQLASLSRIDIDFVFIHITTLVVFFSSSVELQLVGLDVSNQPNLQKLNLASVGGTCLFTATSSQVLMPLYLPPTSPLTYLDISESCLTIMNPQTISFQFLETFNLDYFEVGSFPLAIIVDSMPSLIVLNAAGPLESDTPDSHGRSGAALTTYWLENLNTLHPNITEIGIGGSTQLEFDSNFPIIRSNTLQQFILLNHNQIYVSSMPSDLLTYLPQLTSLTLSNLPNVNFDLRIFEHATTLLASILLSGTNVLGSINSLRNQSNLQYIEMNQSNLGGTLPPDFASIWPNLSVIDFRINSLIGSIPSFANLPLFSSLQISSNQLSGTLPTDFLSGSESLLQVLDISNNLIEGPLPTFTTPIPNLNTLAMANNFFNGNLSALFGSGEQVASMYPALNQIDLQSNQIEGTIPRGLWSLPQAFQTIVLLGQNRLVGSIPSPSQPTCFTQIILSSNPGLTGPFPQNLTADKVDVSYTNLAGPVIIPNACAYHSIGELNLAFTQLSCPMDLSAHQITNLDIQSAGFSGCDINNATLMNINWELIHTLDISNNAFKMFRLWVNPTLTDLRARNCNLIGFVIPQNLMSLKLQTLIVDSNPIGAYFPIEQLQVFISLSRSTISTISLLNCSLSGPIGSFLFDGYSVLPNLNRLLLGSNRFVGVLPVELFAGDVDYVGTQTPLPLSIQEFDISHNQIAGHLPPAALGYSELEGIDISYTNVSGSLPESWSTLISLQRLSVEGTQLSCSNPAACSLPSWLTPSSLTSPSVSIIGAHCPRLSINESPFTLVAIDEEYYQYGLCTCDAKFFGSTGVCQSCPIGCTCVDNIIQGCFPILTVTPSDSDGGGSISIPFIIPCPLSVTGTTLCNPAGVSWSNFDPTEILSITTSSSSYDFTQLNLTSFCAAGHTSRLCSKCVDGYFASGRWCLQCSSDSVHIIIVAINLLMLILLVVIVYQQLPSAVASGIELDAYLKRSSKVSTSPKDDSSDHDVSSSSSSTATAASSILSLSNNRESKRSRKVATVRERTQRKSESPLKLLIFHCQQLSLLLSTATSQPPILTGFLSLVSSGSTGFSLSSLVSLECLNHLWSIEHKVWMSLIAPVLVILVGLCIYFYQRFRTISTSSAAPDLDSISLHESLNADHPDSHISVRESNLDDEDQHIDQQIHRPSANIPRLYGVCLALLYFFLFPCAQTVLSAIACTDTRQYDGSLPGTTSSLYLNLLPWIACDSQWSSTILPPAIIGVLVWIIAFPIATTLLTYYLFKRIRSSPDPSQSVHLWPLCADLFTRFKPQYWYYEQILLVRRLLLVGCVTLIPSDSLYLPVILFSIIQLSALIQHQLHPYESVWLNRGELVSLYLLLLNYVTVLVLHESTSGQLGGHSLDGWSVILFLANLIFILILVGGLFLTFRNHAVQLIQRFCRFICCRRGTSKSSWSFVHLNDVSKSISAAEDFNDDDHKRQAAADDDFHAF